MTAVRWIRFDQHGRGFETTQEAYLGLVRSARIVVEPAKARPGRTTASIGVPVTVTTTLAPPRPRPRTTPPSAAQIAEIIARRSKGLGPVSFRPDPKERAVFDVADEVIESIFRTHTEENPSLLTEFDREVGGYLLTLPARPTYVAEARACYENATVASVTIGYAGATAHPYLALLGCWHTHPGWELAARKLGSDGLEWLNPSETDLKSWARSAAEQPSRSWLSLIAGPKNALAYPVKLRGFRTFREGSRVVCEPVDLVRRVGQEWVPAS